MAIIVNPDELSERLQFIIENQNNKLEKACFSMRYTLPEQKVFFSSMRTLRAYNYHQVVPVIIELVASDRIDNVSKVASLEALGWFDKSFQKDAIISLCEQIIANSGVSEGVKNEAIKTKKRMRSK